MDELLLFLEAEQGVSLVCWSVKVEVYWFIILYRVAHKKHPELCI